MVLYVLSSCSQILCTTNAYFWTGLIAVLVSKGVICLMLRPHFQVFLMLFLKHLKWSFASRTYSGGVTDFCFSFTWRSITCSLCWEYAIYSYEKQLKIPAYPPLKNKLVCAQDSFLQLDFPCPAVFKEDTSSKADCAIRAFKWCPNWSSTSGPVHIGPEFLSCTSEPLKQSEPNLPIYLPILCFMQGWCTSVVSLPKLQRDKFLLQIYGLL